MIDDLLWNGIHRDKSVEEDSLCQIKELEMFDLDSGCTVLVLALLRLSIQPQGHYLALAY